MNIPSRNLLLVDDDTNILEVLEARFTAAGFEVIKTTNGRDALQCIASNNIDMVVSDVKMPNMSGLELYSEIQAVSPGMPIIFLTAYGNIPEAVFAVQAGAIDYLTKPFDGKALVRKVGDYFVSIPGHSESSGGDFDEDGFYWGTTASMNALRETVLRVAATDVNTLVLGESGVGKECIAMGLHKHGLRRKGPYIVVDCGSTPPGILESELFGHTKGAFTNAVSDKKGLIEAAHGGTLFLDEIGNISEEMQHRLLRFLENKTIRRVGSVEEKRVDCRVIAATNADLAAEVKEGKFRKDLYYRLRVVTLVIPPLRERRQDVPALVNLFVRLYAERYDREELVFADGTVQRLQEYSWPGNVRELKNSVEAAVVLCEGKALQSSDFRFEVEDVGPVEVEPEGEPFSLEENEKQAIIRALRETGGVLTSAAELLDISRRSIHYKLKKYRIAPEEYKG